MRASGVRAEREVDGRVIDACREGDPEAFQRLFEAYQDRVFTLALHFLNGDEAAAEDVSQDVFVRLFRSIGSYRGQAAFSTWLYRIVSNACVDEQRRRRRLVSLEAVEAASVAMPAAGTAADLADDEVTGSVRAALAELAPPLRMAIVLKYFEDLSYDEMAAALCCTKGTVASRLHRGLRHLARKLAHLRPGPVDGD